MILSEDDKELLATLIQDEISGIRKVLREAIDLEDRLGVPVALPETFKYLDTLTELLSRVLFS